jgi:hypothetical protein
MTLSLPITWSLYHTLGRPRRPPVLCIRLAGTHALQWIRSDTSRWRASVLTNRRRFGEPSRLAALRADLIVNREKLIVGLAHHSSLYTDPDSVAMPQTGRGKRLLARTSRRSSLPYSLTALTPTSGHPPAHLLLLSSLFSLHSSLLTIRY